MYTIKIDIKKINKLDYRRALNIKQVIGAEVLALLNGHEEITIERATISMPGYYKIERKTVNIES